MMKFVGGATLLVVVFSGSVPAVARDDKVTFPIGQALGTEAAKAKLDPGTKFFFGKQKYPKIGKDFGEWQSNKKANAFAKSDQQACEWAFLSAMIALQERAKKEGANAIINISSNYKNVETSSGSEYVCGAGGLMAGVTLKGRAVNLSGK